MRQAQVIGRGIRFAARVVLFLSIATAAGAACIRPRVACESTSGFFCQGDVLVCEEGWEDAPVGQRCARAYLRKGKCFLFSGCAPYPCSNQPPGCHYLATLCRSGGQCCCCTRGTGIQEETDLYYWFYYDCSKCPAED